VLLQGFIVQFVQVVVVVVYLIKIDLLALDSPVITPIVLLLELLLNLVVL